MITLPDEGSLSRGPLRAFWLAAWLTAGVLASVLPWARPRRRVSLAAAVVGAASVPGLARPEVARRPYRVWDRASRRAADAATRHATWVTHTTAVPASPTDEFQPAAHGEATGWVGTRRQPAQAYPSLTATPAGDDGADASAGRLRRYLRRTRQPRRRWLATCLLVLRWLQDPEEPPRPPVATGDNYTLY